MEKRIKAVAAKTAAIVGTQEVEFDRYTMSAFVDERQITKELIYMLENQYEGYCEQFESLKDDLDLDDVKDADAILEHFVDTNECLGFDLFTTSRGQAVMIYFEDFAAQQITKSF